MLRKNIVLNIVPFFLIYLTGYSQVDSLLNEKLISKEKADIAEKLLERKICRAPSRAFTNIPDTGNFQNLLGKLKIPLNAYKAIYFTDTTKKVARSSDISSNKKLIFSCDSLSNVQSVSNGIVLARIESPEGKTAIMIKNGPYYILYFPIRTNLQRGDNVFKDQLMGKVEDVEFRIEIWKGSVALNTSEWFNIPKESNQTTCDLVSKKKQMYNDDGAKGFDFCPTKFYKSDSLVPIKVTQKMQSIIIGHGGEQFFYHLTFYGVRIKGWKHLKNDLKEEKRLAKEGNYKVEFGIKENVVMKHCPKKVKYQVIYDYYFPDSTKIVIHVALDKKGNLMAPLAFPSKKAQLESIPSVCDALNSAPDSIKTKIFPVKNIQIIFDRVRDSWAWKFEQEPQAIDRDRDSVNTIYIGISNKYYRSEEHFLFKYY